MGGKSSGYYTELEKMELEYKIRIDEMKEKYRQSDDKLRSALVKLWGKNDCCRQDLKNTLSPAVETTADSLARTIFDKSKRTDESGYEEVGLLWKGKSRPKNNGKQALGIFLGMEKRMKSKGRSVGSI